MKKYDIKGKIILPHNILYASTSPLDYSMDRIILLEDLSDIEYDEYVLLEGGHCSCFGFDETEWDCTLLTREELIKIIKENPWGLRNNLKKYIESYIGKEL